MEIVEFFKDHDGIRQEVEERLSHYSKCNGATKEKIGEESISNLVNYEYAIEFMGEVIYDQKTEINVLKEKYGEVDEEMIEAQKALKKKTQDKQEKHRIILNELKAQYKTYLKPLK